MQARVRVSPKKLISTTGLQLNTQLNFNYKGLIFEVF